MHLWSTLQVLKMLENTRDLLQIEQNESQRQYIRVNIENGMQALDRDSTSLVLMNPPFGMDETGERLETKFVNQFLDQMQARDQAAVIVPNGLLSRKGKDMQLRIRLIEAFDLQRIVQLPLSVFAGTAQVHTSILYFTKNKGKGLTEVYDLRHAAGMQELAYIDQNGRPAYILDHSIVRLHDYSLNPSDYPNPSAVTAPGEEALLSRWNALLSQARQMRDSGNDEQLCLFEPVKPPAGIDKRIKLLRMLCLNGWDLLGERLQAFCRMNRCVEKPGKNLFGLCAGQKTDKLPDARYRAYGSSGFQGFSAQQMRYRTSCGLVIGRVGSNCGNVYRPWTDGVVTHNAMQVIPTSDDVDLEIMRLLLHAARLNQYRRGTGQPYIVQSTPLGMTFSLPDPPAQQDFLLQNEGVLSILRQYEREIEEMEVSRFAGSYLRGK